MNGGDRVGALAVLLGAARGEHARAARRRAPGWPPPAAARLGAARLRDAGHPLHPLRPVRGDRRGGPRRSRSVRAARYAVVGQALGDHDVQQRRAASARSVPGRELQVQPRPSSVSAAVGVRRGSTTIRPAALADAAPGAATNGGIVSATLLPSRSTRVGAAEVGRAGTAARGRCRSARFAGRRGRGHAEPAVVVDVRGAAAPPGRTCRARRPSRWSARRRRTPRRCPRRARPGCGGSRPRPGRAPRPR